MVGISFHESHFLWTLEVFHQHHHSSSSLKYVPMYIYHAVSCIYFPSGECTCATISQFPLRISQYFQRKHQRISGHGKYSGLIRLKERVAEYCLGIVIYGVRMSPADSCTYLFLLFGSICSIKQSPLALLDIF